MTLRAGELPWISLALAGSFALYGLIHKLSPRPPLAGLARAMRVWTPLALAALSSWAVGGDSKLIRAPWATQLQLMLTGLALFSFDSFRRARVVAPALVPTRNFPRGLPPEQGNPG